MAGLTAQERNGIYYATGTIDGKRIRKSLSTRDARQAEELCALYAARLWKRYHYGEEAVRTFEEAAVNYLQQGGEGRFLPRILGYFKGRTLASIKPGEIRSMAAQLFPHGSASTRNRQAIIPTRAVINHAHELGWCGALKVRQFDVAKSRKHKPVDRSWMDVFLQQADSDRLPHLSALVLFMHQTGARVSEAVNLLGEHVDLEAAIAMLAKTKTDEWSPRHLTAELVVRIAALGLRSGQRVFRYTDPKAVNRRMAAVCRRAGIARRTTHSAGRHSFGTNTMAAGAHIKDAMDAGGWKSAKLFMETYVHSNEAGRTIAALLDRQRGPIDVSALALVKGRRDHFGKPKTG